MPSFPQIGHGLSRIEWGMSNMNASCHTSMQASYTRFWKEPKRVKTGGEKSVRTLDGCEWRAAAPGLKRFLKASGSTRQPKYLGCPRASLNHLSNPSWCWTIFFFGVPPHSYRAVMICLANFFAANHDFFGKEPNVDENPCRRVLEVVMFLLCVMS